MKKYLFMTFIAAAVLSGCAREETIEKSDVFSGSFTGVLEAGVATKTTLDNLSVRWEDTDQISINGVIYTTTPDATDATRATFTKRSGSEPVSTFKAFFADGSYSGDWDGEHYRLPASYAYKDGKFNMPMYAQSDARTLSFKNICGVLELSLTSSTVASVSKIVISSENQLNGEFTADESGVLTFISANSGDAEKQVTVNVSPSRSLNSTATVFYIPVAPGNHQLTVKVYNEDNYSSITMSQIVTFERNKLYTLSDTKLHYTGGNPANAR